MLDGMKFNLVSSCPNESLNGLNRYGCHVRERTDSGLVPYELTSCTVSKKEVTQRFTEDAQRFTENSLKLCVSPCFLCASLCSFFLVLARPG